MARAEKALKDGTSALRRGEGDVAAEAFALADRELAQAQGMDESWVEPIVLRGRVAYESYALATTIDELVGTLDGAIEFADRALQVEPDDAAALELRGTARYRLWLLQLSEDEDALDRALQAAQADLERSLSLDRSRASVNSTLSHLYYQVGDWPQALLAARQAYQEDAFLAAADGVLRRLFNAAYDLGEYEEAQRWCLEGHDRFPDNFRFVQCQLYVLTMPQAEPDIARAWTLYDQFAELLPEGQSELFSGLAQTFVGGVIGRAGLPDSANAVFVRARMSPEVDSDYEQISREAAMRAVMGDVEGSVETLQRFMILNPGHFPGQHWWWRNLEGDPAFERLKSMY
jgi:tetratricopeptide (TPR) repeat protein